MLDSPGGTGCNVPVHGCWESRDVIVAAVFDCVKECMAFVMLFHILLDEILIIRSMRKNVTQGKLTLSFKVVKFTYGLTYK